MTGSGTAGDPYIISDVNDLQAIENDLTAYYELGGDIDASATSTWNAGAGFVPIGQASPYFTGNFDGKEHTINDLFINRAGSHRQALFGRIDGSAVIQNVIMAGADITSDRNHTAVLIGWMRGSTCTVRGCSVAGSVTSTGTWYLGGLIGEMDGGVVSNCSSSCTVDGSSNPTTYTGGLIGQMYHPGTVENCYATGNVTGGRQTGGLIGQLYASSGSLTNSYASGSVSGGNNVGGLIGERSGSGTFAVTSCYATGAVSGVDYVGGLIGYEYGTTISECYASGNVIASDDYGGGFVGNSQGSYDQCYATGSVTVTDDYAGGFVGINWGNGTITNCYARGAVSGDARVGGFCGDNSEVLDDCYSTGAVTGNSMVGGFCGNNSDTITNSFWDTETSGQATSDGGTGKTTAQMKTETTFTDAGWDFTTPIWYIGATFNNGYPAFEGVLIPTVTTNPATNVKETSATLNGILDDDGGEACEVRFQYGLTTDYGTNTAWQPGKETGNTFSQAIVELVGGNLYHFRAQAKNSAGTANGNDRTLTTITPFVAKRAYALSREEL